MTRTSPRVAIGTLALLALAACGTGRAATGPAPFREVRVRVACDEEFRRRDDWRADALARLREASAPWEREFGIRWSAAECVAWESDDAAATLQDLCDDLAARVGPGGAEIVLGLTGQRCPDGSAGRYGELGITENFGRFALAGAGWPDQPRQREIHAIAHEFGHLLGAWHCADEDSIMSGGSSCVDGFDAQTRRLVPLVRAYDFRRGIDGLDAATIAAIDDLWRRSHGPDARHPVAEAYLFRGWARLASREFRAAADDFRRALDIFDTFVVLDLDRIVSCETGLTLAREGTASPDDEPAR